MKSISLTAYLENKYNGYQGVPSELIKDELLLDSIPKSLKPTMIIKEAGGTFTFFSFIDVATAITDDYNDWKI